MIAMLCVMAVMLPVRVSKNTIFSWTQIALEPIAIEETDITACTHLALFSPAVL